MAEIRLLSNEVIDHIAAGEVIERPASVVKELVENAIDAGASAIAVEIDKTDLLRVVDNGIGMEEEDMSLAIQRHATSKITNTEDLFHITTLGFRGEALPSIVSVSRAKISSRKKDSLFGHFISIEGGAIIERGKAGIPEGTIVEIKDLFYNTPARKKFLKTTATEQRNIIDVVSRYALCYPHIHFSLKSQDRSIINVSPNMAIEDRIKLILRNDLKDRLFEFEKSTPAISIHGFMASPEIFRPTRSSIYTFINKRSVKDPVLTSAVALGSKEFFMKDRYPIAVVMLEIDPKEVDINVHPTKALVRFRDQSKVFGMIASAIKESLKSHPWRDVSFTDKSLLDAPRPLKETFIVSAAPKMYSDDKLLFTEEVSEKKPSFYSDKKIVGILAPAYILLQDDEALYILDQHASHERINFEKLKSIMCDNKPPSQKLLHPLIIELSPTEYHACEELMPHMERLGFECEPFGPRTIAIKAYPPLLKTNTLKDIIISIIIEAVKDDWKSENHEKNMIASIACHRSITSGASLSPLEIKFLLKDLDEAGSPHNCPHGRPLYKKITLSEIEKWLGRRP